MSDILLHSGGCLRITLRGEMLHFFFVKSLIYEINAQKLSLVYGIDSWPAAPAVQSEPPQPIALGIKFVAKPLVKLS